MPDLTADPNVIPPGLSELLAEPLMDWESFRETLLVALRAMQTCGVTEDEYQRFGRQCFGLWIRSARLNVAAANAARATPVATSMAS